MIELIQVSQGIIERGLIFGCIVAAVYLSSRLINFDNLAVEGAFGLGGALTALLINGGINPWLSLIGATLAGGLSGIATGLLTTQLRLNNLMSGIVVTTGLFSINLGIAGANMILSGKETIFTATQPLIMLLVVSAIMFYTLSWFLKTEVGFLLHAVGDAPQMVTNVGKNVSGYLIFGLALSNGLAALSGALFTQYAGYFSIWASVGVLITGLAGMILAQTISKNFGIALLIGSIAYQAIIACTFELQLNQDWNKLVTALLIVLLIVIKQWSNKK